MELVGQKPVCLSRGSEGEPHPPVGTSAGSSEARGGVAGGSVGSPLSPGWGAEETGEGGPRLARSAPGAPCLKASSFPGMPRALHVCTRWHMTPHSATSAGRPRPGAPVPCTPNPECSPAVVVEPSLPSPPLSTASRGTVPGGGAVPSTIGAAAGKLCRRAWVCHPLALQLQASQVHVP